MPLLKKSPSNTIPRRLRKTAATLLLLPTILISPVLSGATPEEPSGTVLGIRGDGFVNTNVTAGDLGIGGNAARTVEAWVYTRSFNQGGVFSMGSPRHTQDFSLRTTGAPDEWRLQFWSEDVDVSFPTVNRWVSMAMVYTGEESILYINGDEVARGKRETPLLTTTDTEIRIGTWRDRDQRPFDGRITEFRIWDRALSREEIRARMGARLAGKIDGLVAYWPLNQQSGSEVMDLITRKEGKLVDGARWVIATPFLKDLPGETIEVLPGDRVVLGPVYLNNPDGQTSYQWYLDGKPLAGETDDTLTISDLKREQAGTYYVVVDDARETTPVESTHVVIEGWADVDLLVELAHPTMEARIGNPAIIVPGGPYPSARVVSQLGDSVRLECEIVRAETGEFVLRSNPQILSPRRPVTVEFPGRPLAGAYRLNVRMLRDGRQTVEDSYYFTVMDPKRVARGYSRIAHPGPDGKLVYIPDYRGNRIPDFSRVGFKNGEEAIPDVPVRITLSPEPGDNTARIQAALNEVGALEPDENGMRGAVLLKKGVYRVGTLELNANGVVLRGEGAGPDGPELMLKPEWLDPDKGLDQDGILQALSGQDATILIRPGRATRTGILAALGGAIEIEETTRTEIVDPYVPVGATTFRVEHPERFRVGDQILVNREGSAEWIEEMGMTPFWSRGPLSFPQGWPLPMERTITAINGNQITIHSPIVNAIEQRWGGGQIYRYDESPRLHNVGFEDMRVMLYSELRDGRLSHVRGTAVLFRNVRDGWVRNVVAEHASDRAFVISDSSRVTVRNCGVLLAPWSYYSGYVPRYGFHLHASANHVLVENSYANHTRHPFVTCAWVPGPNVFLDGRGYDNGATGPHHRWSVGGLFDNVAVGNLEFRQRTGSGSGHGWAGANYVAWNTSGRIENSVRGDGRLIAEQPPTAQNWAIGHIGPQDPGQEHGWNMNTFGYSYGYWESRGQNVKPQSLYLQQLEDRLGPEAAARHRLHRVVTER